MTATRFLSHVRLRRDASTNALAPLLLGSTGRGGATQQSGHHLVWSLFADEPARRRDFLWRQTAEGAFLILSARRPRDRHGLFDVAEPKPFVPALEPGDRLGFSLRANPVIRRRDASGARVTKHDVVMDALRTYPAGERAEQRLPTAEKEGFAWLARQSDKSGFDVAREVVRVDGYEQHRVGRRGGSSVMAFSTLDFEGLLTVTDPASFLGAVATGFGAAKAFGCGLMLIRRAA